MSSTRKLFYNTILLTAASFLMRTVAVSFNVYLTNRIGEDGIGLFQLIFAVYTLAITFAASGIRLAAMRLTADSTAKGENNHRQVMRHCLIYSVICGTAAALAMMFFSELIGTKWIGDTRSVSSLKTLCFCLPFVSMSDALDGYFTAIGKLGRYTVVQFAEQVFKITVTVIALNRVTEKNAGASCAAVALVITSAEIFSLTCSYILYRLSLNKQNSRSKNVLGRLLHISVPDAVGAEMRSVLMTVEHLLIPAGFRKSGSNPQTALATYGVIHGMSLPLVLYPSALLSSLSCLLVPEVSAQHIGGNEDKISRIIAKVLHMTLIFSIGTAGIMYFNAEKLSLAVYGTADAAFYVQVFSPLIPVMYADMSVDGMLKGLDQQVSYMRYNIIDASICVILVYFLVPILSFRGYIIVVFVSELVNFFLSFRRLTKVAEVRIEFFRDMLIPFLCVISANLFKNILFAAFPISAGIKSDAAAEIIFSVLLYALMIMIFRSVDKEELLWIKRTVKP